MCESTFHFWQEGRTYERKNENISKDSICDGGNCICINCFAIDIAYIYSSCFMRYTLYNDYILVQCYIFGTERIPYESITSIKKTWNPLSSAAMSLRRIQIDYTVNGRHEIMLISPVKRDEFLREVEKRMGIQNIKKESL